MPCHLVKVTYSTVAKSEIYTAAAIKDDIILVVDLYVHAIFSDKEC